MSFRIRRFLRSIKAENLKEKTKNKKKTPIELKKIKPKNPNFQELKEPEPQFPKRL